MTSYAITHLKQLEAESIHIMREVVAECDNPVMLYSVGKDSSVLVHLARKAFAPGPLPFPLLHIDTTFKFSEMIEFRDRFCEEIGRQTATIAEGAAQLLLDYSWPGNVRELMNVLQYSLVKTRGHVIETVHLPPEIAQLSQPMTARRAGRKPKLTKTDVVQALREAGGNRAFVDGYVG